MTVDNTKIDVLGKYRDLDDKNAQGEVLPQQETLNPTRVRDYLEKNGYTAQNFDQRFNYKAALDIISGKTAKGEVQMHDALTKAHAYLDSIGQGDLIEQPNEMSFASTLNKELTRRNELNRTNDLTEAYRTYHTIRGLAKRSIDIKAHFTDQRKEAQVNTNKGIKEQFGTLLGNIRTNYGNMTGNEKLITVGGLLVATIWFVKSENETVKKIRSTVWDALKFTGVAVGAGVGVNYLFKLFTGKTALTSLNEYVTSSTADNKLWTETFKTDAKKAEILQKSTVYMGDKDFMDMAQRYREAKANNSNEVRLATVSEKDMDPKEVFLALDTFFSRYPVERMEARYRNYTTRPTWMDVVSTEMAEDGRIRMDANLPSRMLDGAQEYATRGWNWLMVGEGLGIGRYLYLKVRGKNGSDAEVKDFLEELKKTSVMKESELDDFLAKLSSREAAGFKNALHGLNTDALSGVKFNEVPGDALYIVSPAKLDMVAGNEKAMGDAVKNAQDKADEYLKRKYPQLKDNIEKFRDNTAGCRVVENSTFYWFIKMPLPGTPEFDRKSLGLEVEKNSLTERAKGVFGFSEADNRRGKEIFGPNDVIDYSKFYRDSDRERFRLHFLVDSSQSAEIGKICDWYARKYKVLNKTNEEVMDALFNNEDDMKACFKETGVKPAMERKKALLKEIDSDLTSIERSAASNLKGDTTAKAALADELRRDKGYLFRLSILGDPAARSKVTYDPNKPEELKKAKEDYEKYCKDFVDKRNVGAL